MIKKIILALCFMQLSSIHSTGVFLWEYQGNGSRSCCLHLSDTDICNPDVPCTRTISVDLGGIYEYIGRILVLEKSSTFPFYFFFKQAQNYIKKGITTPLGYRFDYFVSGLKFYHELAAEVAFPKTDKSKVGTTGAAATSLDKAKQDELTLKYLMKIGLVKQLSSRDSKK